MAGRLALGTELLRFFVNHNHIIVDDEFGQVLICHRSEMGSLQTPINIPTGLLIPKKLLQYLLARGGFTEKEFWEEIE